MSKSRIGSFKLEIIKNQLLSMKEGVLREVMDSLPTKDIKGFIILAEQVLSSREVPFKFNKECRDSWYSTFDNIYSDSDEGLVLERLEQIKSQVDIGFKEEYQYLSSWYKRECSVGGLYNFF